MEFLVDTILILTIVFIFGAACTLVVLVVGTIYLEIRTIYYRRRTKRYKGWITDAIREERDR